MVHVHSASFLQNRFIYIFLNLYQDNYYKHKLTARLTDNKTYKTHKKIIVLNQGKLLDTLSMLDYKTIFGSFFSNYLTFILYFIYWVSFTRENM